MQSHCQTTAGKTYSSVGCLLLLVTLLVGSSLGLVGSLLLVVQALPLLTKDLADLACDASIRIH